MLSYKAPRLRRLRALDPHAMAAPNAPQTPLLEHVEAPSAEANAPPWAPTPADVDPESARDEEQTERAHASGYARFSDGQKRVMTRARLLR